MTGMHAGDNIGYAVEAYYDRLWEELCALEEAEYEREARLWELEALFFEQFVGDDDYQIQEG